MAADVVADDAEIVRVAAEGGDQGGEAERRWRRRSGRGRERCPGGTSSSPVAMSATRGRRRTGSVPWPMAAASETCAHAEPRAGREEDGALGEVEAGAADMPAGLRRLADADGAVGEGVGVLLDQDRVGAFGHRRAGEDADRLAGRRSVPREAGAGGGGADDTERRAVARVGGAERVAVHGGGGEGRLR